MGGDLLYFGVLVRDRYGVYTARFLGAESNLVALAVVCGRHDGHGQSDVHNFSPFRLRYASTTSLIMPSASLCLNHYESNNASLRMVQASV